MPDLPVIPEDPDPWFVNLRLSRPAAEFLRSTVAHMNQAKILPDDNRQALQTSAWLEEIEAAFVEGDATRGTLRLREREEAARFLSLRQEAEVKRLREALREIAEWNCEDAPEDAWRKVATAREALDA